MQISWQHVISLLDFNIGRNRCAPGLRMTKLTPEHVFLTPRSRMNVSLAAQVEYLHLNFILFTDYFSY